MDCYKHSRILKDGVSNFQSSYKVYRRNTNQILFKIAALIVLYVSKGIYVISTACRIPLLQGLKQQRVNQELTRFAIESDHCYHPNTRHSRNELWHRAPAFGIEYIVTGHVRRLSTRSWPSCSLSFPMRPMSKDVLDFNWLITYTYGCRL
jgi:hypothetical protein